MANIVRKPQKETSRSLPTLWNFWDDPFRAMDNLIRWEPYRSAERWLQSREANEFIPRFDVKETKDSFVFRADLPGFKEDDIDISVIGNSMTISGKREEEERKEDDNYLVTERSVGSFQRFFTLPESADPAKVKAEMKNGVLEIILSKSPSAQPQRIPIGNQNIKTGNLTSSSGQGAGSTHK